MGGFRVCERRRRPRSGGRRRQVMDRLVAVYGGLFGRKHHGEDCCGASPMYGEELSRDALKGR